MNKFRGTEMIFKGPDPHWVGNGFRVSQYFPKKTGRVFFERFSPFLLMDYNLPCEFKASVSNRGVSPHPHRGLETVSIMFEGYLEHGDNKGHSGVIGPGDVQWMTSGSGILHKEYHEKEYAKKDRTFHMIQLWVNLPAKDKMTEPKYQTLLKDDMGIYKVENDGGEVRVFAGEFKGVKGPASTFSPINMYRVILKKGHTIEIEEPSTFNTGVIVINGDFKLNETETLDNSEFCLFKNEEGKIKLEAVTDVAELIVLSGEPLNEPVVAYGPFVMNTKEEIDQANKDYYSGQFGSDNF